MRNGTPIRRSPAVAIKFLLGTRMSAESGASHRKQRPEAHSTRYTKRGSPPSRDAVLRRSSLASPDALPAKPAPSARHTASPGWKLSVNQKTCASNILPALRPRTGAASPAQAFCLARPSIFLLRPSLRPRLPASVPPRRRNQSPHFRGIPRTANYFYESRISNSNSVANRNPRK